MYEDGKIERIYMNQMSDVITKGDSIWVQHSQRGNYFNTRAYGLVTTKLPKRRDLSTDSVFHIIYYTKAIVL